MILAIVILSCFFLDSLHGFLKVDDMPKEKFFKGNVIIQEGSTGTNAYIVLFGKVELSSRTNNKKQVHSVLGVNQVFGEMGLIVDEPQPITAIALENTELEVINRKAFNDFFSKGNGSILTVLAAFLKRLKTAGKELPVNEINKSKEDVQKDEASEMKNALPLSLDDTTESIKTEPEEKIIDNRYVVMTGISDISKEALKYRTVEIKHFPFKVGRFTNKSAKTNGKILIKDNVLAENDLYIHEEGPNYYISENHFLIGRDKRSFVITDRGSRLGIIVNNIIVKGTCLLEEENIVTIGSHYSPYSFKLEIKGSIIRQKRENKVENIEKKETVKGFQTVEVDSISGISGISGM